MNIVGVSKVLIFSLFLFVAAFLGTLFFAGWFLPLLFLRPLLYRHIFDAAIGVWEWLVVALLEKLLGLRVIITGDLMLPGEQSLIIMNHRTCLDWLYFWSVLVRQSGVSREKIILKYPLKFVPGAGWAMQAACFLFLRRRWDNDQSYLSSMIEYFHNINYRTQILLFPEGTDFNEESKAKSDSYAAKNGLPAYKHLLHPRTTGFTYLTSQLRKLWPDCTLYDVTVAYSDENIPQTERDLFRGNFTTTVHFDVCRHRVSELPEGETDLARWCNDLWSEKEQKLEEFHKNLTFQKSAEVSGSDGKLGKLSGGGDFEDSSVNSRAKGFSEPSVQACMYAAVGFWLLYILGFLWAFVCFSVVRWLCLFHVGLFVYMGRYRGGFELFQAEYFSRFFRRTSRSELPDKNE